MSICELGTHQTKQKKKPEKNKKKVKIISFEYEHYQARWTKIQNSVFGIKCESRQLKWNVWEEKQKWTMFGLTFDQTINEHRALFGYCFMA